MIQTAAMGDSRVEMHCDEIVISDAILWTVNGDSAIASFLGYLEMKLLRYHGDIVSLEKSFV